MPLNHDAEPKTRLGWKAARYVLFAAVAGLTVQVALSQQVGPPPAPSKDDAEAAILDRQLVMQDLDKDAANLGDVAAGLKPASELAADAQTLAKDAKAAQKSFMVGAPGGNAKPEVWSAWDDFSKRMDAFVKNSQTLADTTASPKVELSAISELMISAMPCTECHNVYRIEKKK